MIVDGPWHKLGGDVIMWTLKWYTGMLGWKTWLLLPHSPSHSHPTTRTRPSLVQHYPSVQCCNTLFRGHSVNGKTIKWLCTAVFTYEQMHLHNRVSLACITNYLVMFIFSLLLISKDFHIKRYVGYVFWCIMRNRQVGSSCVHTLAVKCVPVCVQNRSQEKVKVPQSVGAKSRKSTLFFPPFNLKGNKSISFP